MEEKELIYILVLNWNGWRDTVECVESCLRISHPNLKVLIIDNGSSDDSESRLRERFPQLEFLQNGENLGYAGGNNAGIRYALRRGAQYVWLLNNDTVIDPDAAEFLLQAAVADKVGVVGGKILVHAAPEKIWCVGADIDWSIGQPRLKGYLQADDGSFDAMQEMETISGCSMFIKREVFERVGLMDDRFFLYFEETDWIERVKKAGYRVIYQPQARIFHKTSASVGGADSPLMRYYLSRNCTLFVWKNRSFPAFLKYVILSLTWFYPVQFKKGWQSRTMTKRHAKAIFTGLLHGYCGRYGRYNL